MQRRPDAITTPRHYAAASGAAWDRGQRPRLQKHMLQPTAWRSAP